VPTTLGFFYLTDPMNATMLARMDAYCVDNARHFAQWAREDPRLVGIFPFYWLTQSGIIGLQDLPLCQAEWVAFGREVVAAAGASGGERPRGGGQPARRHTCPSPTEKVKHSWCRKDV
jgi:hypothetical protein